MAATSDPRSVAMVYDRLHMRTNFPYKPFEVSEATERIVDNFMELYFNWHLVGSGLLDGEEEDGGEEVKRALAKVLTCPDLEWFRGQAEQWVTLEEDGAIKGSADKMLFIRKMDAKIFSRTDKFVGFVCITGPPGGGKGTVIYTLRRFGGDGRANLCHNMGATYLFDDRVRGAEDCKPVLAGLAGKAAGYCDEYPNRRINPETVKPLICARGGQVSARFGGPRRGRQLPWRSQPRSLVPAITPSASPWNRRDGRQDLGSHPRVHFRERGTGFHFFKQSLSSFVHVFLSFAFFDCAFVPEYFWFMRKLFRFVNDDRIVKGRTWWPLPQALSVAPHLESVREEGSAVEGAVIEQLFQEVPRARQGDNKLLVQKTLNFLGAAGNTEHFFARNGISTEHARSTSGARLYSVLVRISESRQVVFEIEAEHA